MPSVSGLQSQSFSSNFNSLNIQIIKIWCLRLQKNGHRLPNLNIFTIYVTVTGYIYIYILCNMYIYIYITFILTLNTYFLIFRSQPSGNCLCSSLSTQLFGNNDYIDKLRVLSSIDLFMYPSYYCKYPCFLSLSKTFEKSETHFFTMSIKNSTIDSDLKNEEAVNFEVQTNCKGKNVQVFFV